MNLARFLPAASLALALAASLTFASSAPAGAQTADLFTGFSARSNDPIQIDAGSLEISEEGKQRISVFSGNVLVRRGDTSLRASTIRIYSPVDSKGPERQNFTRIEATGDVLVTSGPQKVTGKEVVVDMIKQTIAMTGGVVLSQGPNVITGDRLVVDLASGRARVEQKQGERIRGVFTPGSGNPMAPGQ